MTKTTKMPEEAINIYTALKYLSNEAQADGLPDVEAIINRANSEIINLYFSDICSTQNAEEIADSLFLGFMMLTKYLTCGSEKAKQEFLQFLSVNEKFDIGAHTYG